MYKTVVADGETPHELSLRLNCPMCMILRANGLFSTAWLYAGREIFVPDANCCVKSPNACPVKAADSPILRRRLYIIADGETLESVLSATGLSESCVLASTGLTRSEIGAGTRAVCLPVPPSNLRTHTVKPSETLMTIAPSAKAAMKIRALNAVWGSIYPGMKLLIPSESE